ncbi:MAG TPA: response regulator transcription factor [Solirubrobacteraceae bacterium]|jgi:DNA-binding NarL/FixJ family response regulator|nr:response regulator transcription factor [Solirubrobacteraceae bacterium]
MHDSRSDAAGPADGRRSFAATADVLPGRQLAPRGAAGEFVESAEQARTPNALERPLTPREREVMTLVACGLRSSDVAERLCVSPETVRTHVHNAMGKLGSRTRAHAVAIALTTGQITYVGAPTTPDPQK